MSNFIFDNFALATLDGAKKTSDGSSLSMQQKQDVLSYLRSPQSGPDGVTSFADYVATKMLAAGRRATRFTLPAPPFSGVSLRVLLAHHRHPLVAIDYGSELSYEILAVPSGPQEHSKTSCGMEGVRGQLGARRMTQLAY